MKLRARGPARRGDEDAVEAVREMPPPASQRRPARKSMAPRAAEPTPARPRPRAAPKGGVQKRKSVRPTARPRTAAPTPSRSARRTARPLPEQDEQSLAAPADDNHHEDEADGVAEEADVKVQGVEQERRVVKAAAPTTIDDLPEEVMLGIFSYFRPPQLCWKIGRVCRRWASWSVAPFLWRGKEYTLSPDPSLSSRRKGKA